MNLIYLQPKFIISFTFDQKVFAYEIYKKLFTLQSVNSILVLQFLLLEYICTLVADPYNLCKDIRD